MLAIVCSALLVLPQDGAAAPAAELQKDYEGLKALASEFAEMRQGGATDPEARQKMSLMYRELRAKSEAFIAEHYAGDLDEAKAKLLITSLDDPSLGLMNAWVSHAMGHAEPAQFLMACDVLEKSGLSEDHSKRFLDSPRLAATFAAGDRDDEALSKAMEMAEAAGQGGLAMLDVAAAIHAARGEYEKARELYVHYKENHAPEEDRRAYAYEGKIALIGKAAPALSSSTWIGPDGGKGPDWAGLDDLKGKVVVLDFWQTWCGPCRVVMPGLSHLQEQLGDERFQILGMCYKDGRPGFDHETQSSVPAEEIEGENYVPHVTKFSDDMDLQYVIGVAEDRANSTAYQVRGIPTLVVLDGDGVVAWETIGSSPTGEMVLKTLAQRLMARPTGAR